MIWAVCNSTLGDLKHMSWTLLFSSISFQIISKLSIWIWKSRCVSCCETNLVVLLGKMRQKVLRWSYGSPRCEKPLLGMLNPFQAFLPIGHLQRPKLPILRTSFSGVQAVDGMSWEWSWLQTRIIWKLYRPVSKVNRISVL